MSKTSRTASRRKTAGPSRHITPEDLLQLCFVGDPQISPDGSRLLFSRRHVGEKNKTISQLWTVAVSGGQPRPFTTGEKDSHGRFSPDGERIAFLSEREKRRPQIYVLSSSGGEASPLTRFPEGTIRGFKWSPDGKWLAVAFRKTDPDWTTAAEKKREETGSSIPPRVIDQMFYRLDGDGYFNKQRFALYLVDTQTGEHKLLYDKDSIGWFSFDWSPDSREIALTTNTAREPFLKYWKWDLVRLDVHTGRVKKLAALPEGHKSVVAWSPDGKHLAYTGREGREHWGVRNTQLFVCDTDGHHLRNLTAGTDYCLSAITLSDCAEAAFTETLVFSPDSRRIFLNFGWRGETHVASVPLTGGDVVFHTKGRRTMALGNISRQTGALALTVADALRPPEVAVGQFRGAKKTGTLSLRTRTAFNRPLLAERELSAPEPHWVKSADGTRVHTWIMKPPGFQPGKKYPAVLEIHGGPHTQYGEVFFHEFQTFAAAGYVVVFSNPRGSKGYGEEHCAAIRGQWGKADWADIQAVTEFMKQQPFIDTARMGVCGGSYGGYMTNWVIGHTDDFAAAVTDRCVANLVSMVGSSDLPLVPGEYWDGNSWDKAEVLWEQSPLRYFGNVKTPTLVIHSEGDLRCNVEQGEQVFSALKLRGIATRFVRYPATTSHGMSRNGPADLRLHRLHQYLDWWQRYLHR